MWRSDGPVSTPGRLFAAQLRAGHKRAQDRLRAALRRHGGSVRDAATDLGIHRGTLYDLAAALPEVRAILDAEGMGRSGARQLGAHAPKKRGSSRGSEKSTSDT